jgi:Flp pilus assembly protein TadG
MKTRFNRRRRKGAAMVEFGACLSLFLMLLLAMFEGGRVYMVTMILNMACRVAARDAVASSNVTTQMLKDKIKAVCASGGLNPDYITVSVTDASILDENPKMDDETWGKEKDKMTELDVTTARPRQLGIFRAEVPFGSVALVTPKWVAAGTVL